MDVLRFKLSGKNAFFKKPEVNSYLYFTYGNIHKVALLGIFGAILGYGGYTKVKDYQAKKKKKALEEDYPEFYEKLRDVKVSILPDASKGLITKKVQTFNNSVGYASHEQGGNLIVKEQWLDNPSWEICVLLDCEEAKKIAASIIDHRCVYYPYLGKNDHMASITEAQIESIQEIKFEIGRMDCLVLKKNVIVADLDEEEQEKLDAYMSFKYEEMLPIGMDSWVNQYFLEKFIYTDGFLEMQQDKVYELQDEKKIMFY